MKRLLIYVMKADTGKAPKIEGGSCSLSGCMRRTIEKNAKEGDWIIGIGGKTLCDKTGEKGKFYKKIVYAMKVEKNPRSNPSSTRFYFFGDNAKVLPKNLSSLTPVNSYGNMPRLKYHTGGATYKRFEEFIASFKEGKHGNHCTLKTRRARSKKCGSRC